MNELNSRMAQTRKVQLGAPPAQVIETHHCPVGVCGLQPDRERASNEAGASENQNFAHWAFAATVTAMIGRFRRAVLRMLDFTAHAQCQFLRPRCLLSADRLLPEYGCRAGSRLSRDAFPARHKG